MIKIHKCLRCDHEWPSRNPDLPRYCAGCGTKYWNIPRRQNGYAPGFAPKGPARVYKFHDLEIGQEVIEPWPEELAHRPRIIRALAGYKRRTGKKFYSTGQPQGLWIKRIA